MMYWWQLLAWCAEWHIGEFRGHRVLEASWNEKWQQYFYRIEDVSP